MTADTRGFVTLAHPNLENQPDLNASHQLICDKVMLFEVMLSLRSQVAGRTLRAIRFRHRSIDKRRVFAYHNA